MTDKNTEPETEDGDAKSQFTELRDNEQLNNAIERGRDMGREYGQQAGETLATGITLLCSLLGTMLFELGTLIPKSGTIFKRMFYAGAHGYYRKSGGDALGLNALPNGGIEAIPVKYKQAIDDADEQPGWKAKGREKTWHEGAGGRDTDRLGGKTPVVLLDDDATERYPRSMMRAVEGLDLDQYSPVYTQPKVEQVIQLPEGFQDDGERARADGGQMVKDIDWQVTDHGEFGEDVWIDPTTPAGDGLRLSLRSSKELLAEKTDSQKIRDAKQRGILAGMDPGDTRDQIKMLIICGLIIVGALFVVLVLPDIIGGSASGVTDGMTSPISLMPNLGFLGA